MHQIKEVGLEKWLEEQRKRQALLEGLLQNYNEGRSMNFYCKTCARMSVELINKAVKEAKKKFVTEEVVKSDIKSKAKMFKTAIRDFALKTNVNLN